MEDQVPTEQKTGMWMEQPPTAQRPVLSLGAIITTAVSDAESDIRFAAVSEVERVFLHTDKCDTVVALRKRGVRGLGDGSFLESAKQELLDCLPATQNYPQRIAEANKNFYRPALIWLGITTAILVVVSAIFSWWLLLVFVLLAFVAGFICGIRSDEYALHTATEWGFEEKAFTDHFQNSHIPAEVLAFAAQIGALMTPKAHKRIKYLFPIHFDDPFNKRRFTQRTDQGGFLVVTSDNEKLVLARW